MIVAVTVAAALLAACPEVRLVDSDDREVSKDAIKMSVSRVKKNGVCQVRCHLVAMDETVCPKLCRLIATMPFAGTGLVAFDGAGVSPLSEGVRRNPLMKKTSWSDGYAMFGAVWDKDRGVALGTGADGEDSFVELTIRRKGEMAFLSVAVNAAFLRKGAEYSCTFNAIAFDPKYGERDALARYYALYPRQFKRASEVNPAVYGTCAGYQSWMEGNPEACRFMNATWEWCHGSCRHWGDILSADMVKGAPMGDYTYVPRLRYLTRDGREVVRQNASLTPDEFLAVQRFRMSHGYYCGVANGLYMMALSNISNVLAGRYADSLEAGDPVYPNPYPYSTYVWAFPECSWGRELMRQLTEVSGREDLGCIAFDVSAAGGVYRGTRLAEMRNVGWDSHGPGVARGIANGKIFDFVRSLPCKRLSGRMGSAVNTCPGQLNDVLHADMIMIEQPPWQYEPPYPKMFRYAAGEKGITFWEGYSPRDFDANFHKWPKAEQEDLIRQLSRYAVHQQFKWGVSLPTHFLTEYVSRVSRAFALANDAGWKPVPGAEAPSGFSLTRYGLGVDSVLAVNNLTNVEQTCCCRLYTDELNYGLVGGKGGNDQILFAPYFGGVAKNCVADGTGTVSCVIGPLLVNVLEAVGHAVGRGSVDVSWSGDFTRIRLRFASKDFRGRVDVRPQFGSYRTHTDSLALAEGESQEVVFDNDLLAGQEDAYRSFQYESDFVIRHAPDGDSRDIAERTASFFRRATGRKHVLAKDAAMPVCSVALIAPSGVRLDVSGRDRMTLSGNSRRYLNAINAERYPDYRPTVELLPCERRYFSFQRH